jgi:hypothetical protein
VLLLMMMMMMPMMMFVRVVVRWMVQPLLHVWSPLCLF